MTQHEIILANPRGFCAGVERAIAIVERALAKVGAPLYVRHEVVHNHFVCEGLRQKGVIFIESLADAPAGATVVFSAHGVSPVVYREAEERQLNVFDATCPLVTKVHQEVKRFDQTGRQVIMIGHAGHPEVEGTMGQAKNMALVNDMGDVDRLPFDGNEPLAFVTQTTLSVDDTEATIARLKQRFPDIVGTKKDDICYATQNRQDAVKRLAAVTELVLVVGSPTSSNSNRLCEVARNHGVAAYLIDTVADIDNRWLVGKTAIGITAGASAPESLVQSVVDHLSSYWPDDGDPPPLVRDLEGLEENVRFRLPKGLEP